jgi:anti-sigma factor RsiW
VSDEMDRGRTQVSPGDMGRERPRATLPPLSREESLFLDGALSPEATRAMEERIAVDAALRARVEAWRESSRLWKDDATRAATALDPERILGLAWREAKSGIDDATAQAVATRAAKRYVRAAAVLLAFGAGGTAWLAATDAPATLDGIERRDLALDGLEKDRLELQGALELLALPVATPATKGG